MSTIHLAISATRIREMVALVLPGTLGLPASNQHEEAGYGSGPNGHLVSWEGHPGRDGLPTARIPKVLGRLYVSMYVPTGQSSERVRWPARWIGTLPSPRPDAHACSPSMPIWVRCAYAGCGYGAPIACACPAAILCLDAPGEGGREGWMHLVWLEGTGIPIQVICKSIRPFGRCARAIRFLGTSPRQTAMWGNG